MLGTSGPLVAHKQINARGVGAAKREDHSEHINQVRLGRQVLNQNSQ